MNAVITILVFRMLTLGSLVIEINYGTKMECVRQSARLPASLHLTKTLVELVNFDILVKLLIFTIIFVSNLKVRNSIIDYWNDKFKKLESVYLKSITVCDILNLVEISSLLIRLFSPISELI